jgi:hypothetical protein
MYQASVCGSDVAAGRYGDARTRSISTYRARGSCTNAAFSDPDLVDPLPLLFSDLLTPPTYRDVVTRNFRYAIVATGFR